MPTIDDGRKAIEEGNPQQARLIFEAILQENKRNEDAWLGLAEVLTNSEDKRVCYDNVLKINSGNRVAREGLRNLEPQANPFVKELGSTAPEPDMAEGDEPTGDETIMSMRPPIDEYLAADGAAEGGPPTFALVALGLALSVVVFAVGGGIVFFLLTSLTG